MASAATTYSAVRQRLQSFQRRVANMREKADEVVSESIGAVEVVGAAAGWGFANRRFGQAGEIKLAGVPADLGVGIALHGLAFAGAVSAKYASHLHALGNGSLGAYAYRFGDRYAAAHPGTGTSTGALPQRRDSPHGWEYQRTADGRVVAVPKAA